VPPEIVLLTAFVAAVAAVALTGWMGRVAGVESAWLRCGLHVLLAGFGGAGAAAIATTWVETVTFAALALACALLVVIDQASFRLPNVIIGPTYLLLLGGLTAAAAMSGDWERLGRAAAGGGVLLVAYFALAWVNPSGLGLGDVKLSGMVGAFLGWFGWPHVFAGTMAGFLLSGLVAVVILITRRGGLKSDFPFGPWMILGAAGGLTWAFVVAGA